MTNPSKVTQRICGSCGGVFIGDNPSVIKVSIGSDIPVDKFKLIVCSKSIKKDLCLTNNLINRVNVINKSNITGINYNSNLSNNALDDIVNTLNNEFRIKPDDRFVTLEWVDSIKSNLPNVYYIYTATTIINNTTLSINLHFISSIKEAYLEFLDPLIIKDEITSGMSFNVLEGHNIIAYGLIK